MPSSHVEGKDDCSPGCSTSESVAVSHCLQYSGLTAKLSVQKNPVSNKQALGQKLREEETLRSLSKPPSLEKLTSSSRNREHLLICLFIYIDLSSSPPPPAKKQTTTKIKLLETQIHL